jgi:hypothetical protein
MKKLFSLFFPLILLTLFCGRVLAAPQLVIPSPAYHFGTIAEGSKLEHVFSFTNRGDETLLIERVRSTCGCTGTLLSQKEIPPGKSGEVKIIFNSRGMRGPVVKWIYLYSNDPGTPKARLQINGIVQPEIDVTPARLRLTDMRPGEMREAFITLTNNSEQPVFLSNLKTVPEALSATLSDTRLPPGASTKIKIRLHVPSDKTHQNGYIHLTTSSPRTPKIRISVFGIVRRQTP